MIKSTKTRYSNEFYYYANDYIIGRSIEKYGEYSQVEVDFLTSILRKDSVVYDIGANIGYHTTAFASVANTVIGFEPHPKTFELLKRNTQQLKNVKILNCAVSNFTGPAYCSDYNIELAGNYGNMSISESSGVEIQCIDFGNCHGFPLPDLIKIDVEGSEYPVIQSCMTLLKQKAAVVYYEAHETVHLTEIYELLQPLGYRFYWMTVDNYNVNNLNKSTENMFGNNVLTNIVAWPGDLPELGLYSVQDKNDTVENYYARLGFNYVR